MIAKEICIEITLSYYEFGSSFVHRNMDFDQFAFNVIDNITSCPHPVLMCGLGWGWGWGGGDVLLLDNKVSGRHYARPTGFPQRLSAP